VTDPDLLFPPDPRTREVARILFAHAKDLPIISPHGHVDPWLLADDRAFGDPAQLLIVPDHYVTRLLYSQGVDMDALGVTRRDGAPVQTDGRAIWRLLAEHWSVFRATPSRLWLELTLAEVFDIRTPLSVGTADAIYDALAERLAGDAFRPRALFERFGIEVLATTESATDDLAAHAKLAADGWSGRVVTTFRPDDVVDPEWEGWGTRLDRLGEMTGEDTLTYRGYLAAVQARRDAFRAAGARSTDHGHPTARTADLSPADAEALFLRVAKGAGNPGDADLFRGQMLTEMARMSLDDGLVLQIHPGAWRNHNAPLFDRFGANVGADIPTATDYVGALRPLLNRFGNDPALSIIVFTLDESTYARELAPLAGHYPALKLGPSWWFHDSPEGMMRFREQTTETAGFYNTVGFNDDTRAFMSIPSRHDVARRVDCSFLARMVVEHRLPEDEAALLAPQLAYEFPKKAYKL